MDEIKFELDERGEPVCSSDCIGFSEGNIVDCHWRVGSTCIPGLRQQRDDARANLGEVMAWRHDNYGHLNAVDWPALDSHLALDAEKAGKNE